MTKKQQQPGTAKKKTPQADALVVASKVKDFIKSQGLQSSADVVPALNAKIHNILTEATTRTQNNKRSTVRPHDL